MQNYILGIDLHGTLLNKDEKISSDLIEILAEKLKNKPNNLKVYICTGNDASFIRRKIPSAILNYFDGSILETGCTLSFDNQQEIVLTSQKSIKQMKILEEKLKQYNFPEIYKFARRLATISMFTKHEYSVEEFYQKILDLKIVDDFARVTYSSVAVDIIPKDFDKYYGLLKVKESFPNAKIIGVADSMNDAELIEKSDYSFVPANYNPKLEKILSKKFEKLDKAPLNSSKIFITKERETEGVIELLDYLAHKII